MSNASNESIFSLLSHAIFRANALMRHIYKFHCESVAQIGVKNGPESWAAPRHIQIYSFSFLRYPNENYPLILAIFIPLHLLDAARCLSAASFVDFAAPPSIGPFSLRKGASFVRADRERCPTI